jgi:hypothetical protein
LLESGSGSVRVWICTHAPEHKLSSSHAFLAPHVYSPFPCLATPARFPYPSPDIINTRTAQLMTVKTGGRRYVDTGVLIRDFTSSPFDSTRHATALARMNWLHSRYDISNDDMLYTLSVFVTCPQRWLERFEWRGLTELEVGVCLPRGSFVDCFASAVEALVIFFWARCFASFFSCHMGQTWIPYPYVSYIPQFSVQSLNPSLFLRSLTSRHGGPSGAKSATKWASTPSPIHTPKSSTGPPNTNKPT